MKLQWGNFKSFVDARSLSIQWDADSVFYQLSAHDGPLTRTCAIIITDPASEEQLDFEDNYKSNGNKKFTDSDGIPMTRQRAFANDDGFRFRGKGISGTAIKNTTTNIDYKLTEARSINGVKLICKNQVFGDTVKFQIVDVDNILGYGAGVVLDEFGSNWNIVEDSQDQGMELLPYRANILTNLYIRIVYISVGETNDVLLRANLYLHKKT